jgi:uncharacterized UPF0160 family protein
MEITIGKYRILTSHGKVWIFINSKINKLVGKIVSEKEFEKVVEEFYNKHF